MQDDFTDTNMFLNWTTLYSDGVVDVNLINWKGTFVDKVEFTVSVGYVHENVCFEEMVVVDERLAFAGESKYSCE